MDLAKAPESRRADGELIAANHRPVDRQRQERVRVADGVVVEKFAGLGTEMIDVDRPAIQRNRDPDLIFLVALAVQRQKA